MKPISRNIGAPDAKNIAAQRLSTSMACPKSGWRARIAAIAAASRPEMSRPGGPPCSIAPAISQAAVRASAGLMNSDGCSAMKPSEYQRAAPLPKSVPNQGSAAIAMKETRNSSTPKRRMVRSEEHTSELQSRGHLVCRLLLEKKNELHSQDNINTPQSYNSVT